MDNRLTPQQQDALIEDALSTHPLAPLPVDLTSAVMARIRTAPAPRFRLTWADGALSLALTLSLLAAWIGFQALPAMARIQLRIQGILLWQRFMVNADWLIPSILILAGGALGLFALMNLLRQPRLDNTLR
ncbi:MAG: hypothetical protein ACOY0R_05070 [Chloroflexota bacterium]